MKVALLGDIHANLPALETVLDHAFSQGIDAIWNTGDWVGYNAFPNQVVTQLRESGAISIVGNYDLKVLRFKKKKKKWRHSKNPRKYLAFRWTYKTLTDSNKQYLRTLPLEIVMRFGKVSVMLTHGSPVSNKEPLTLETPAERLQLLAGVAGTDIIICGHSHRPFARTIENVWFINTGSVGRSDDGDNRASYAILTLSGNQISVEHFRLVYPVEQAVAEIYKQNLPPEFGQMLQEGVPLEQITAID